MFTKQLVIPLRDIKYQLEEITTLTGFSILVQENGEISPLENCRDFKTKHRDYHNEVNSSDERSCEEVNSSDERSCEEVISSDERSSKHESSGGKENRREEDTMSNDNGEKRSRRTVAKVCYKEPKVNYDDEGNSGEGDSDWSTSVHSSEESEEEKRKTVIRKEVKRKRKKKKKEKIKSIYVFSSTEESSDQDYIGRVIVPRKKYQKRSVKKKGRKSEAKSEYEIMIEKNRAEKMAFLQTLNMDDAKAGLLEVLGAMKPAKRPHNKKSIKKTVGRKSRRLANENVEFSDDVLFPKTIPIPNPEKKAIPPELSFKEAMESEELYETFVKDVIIQESETELKFLSYDVNAIKNLQLDETRIVMFKNNKKITALAWHPSPETLIVAAGVNAHGYIGVWNVASKSSPHLFKSHLKDVTNLQFNPWNPVELVSSSYDGTLRSGDMVKHIFREFYNVADEETGCLSFDFLSQSSYIVGKQNGSVAVVDNRIKMEQSEVNNVCFHSHRTVSVHPVNKDYFLTAGKDRSISLWDLRNLQEKPVFDISHHKGSVISAYFSPVSGNSILSTSFDDTVCIFDSTNLTSDISLRHQMMHKNFINKGHYDYVNSTWLPNSEEAFVIGGTESMKTIDVHYKNMDVLHKLKHDNLTTSSCINAFHPFRSTLAATSLKGEVLIFI